jgi:hypothetical protein
MLLNKEGYIMTTYYDKNYGADADGNRGIPVWEIELDNSDTQEILDILEGLKEEYTDDEGNVDFPAWLTITLYCEDVGENVEFEIQPSDYL